MFETLQQIFARPQPFEFYTASDLWTDEYTAQQMLQYHLNTEVDAASRNHAFINRSTDWIIQRFGLDDSKRVIDFGCGPGLYCQRLARSGASVTGIDFSSNSLDYAKAQAREEGLEIDYQQANYLEYEPEAPADLAIMIMCDYCAMSPEQRSQMLGVVRQALKPDGVFLFDVYSLSAFEARSEASICERNQLNGFWSPEEYYGFVNTMKYDADKVILDKYTLVEANRTRVVYNWLQYFSPESLEQELNEAGFEVVEFLGDVAGGKYDPEASEYAVIIAPK